MKQILQDLKRGDIIVEQVPVPLVRPGYMLIRTGNSLISAGTERMLLEFGRANILDKARQQPEKVRQVLDKLRTGGIAPTMRAVRAKLEKPIPLGYSNAGVVVEAGAGVTAYQVGDRVVSNGQHAECVCVPENLCARIPAGVHYEAASFTVVAAIALQGMVVMGLGLIGLLALQLLRANGCQVLGVDPESRPGDARARLPTLMRLRRWPDARRCRGARRAAAVARSALLNDRAALVGV